jgi:hypothetical protein
MIPVAAFSEPDLSQVFEAFIAGDVGRGDVAMIIENRLWLSELEIQLFASGGGEQKILGKKGFVHGLSQVRVLRFKIRPGGIPVKWSDLSLWHETWYSSLHADTGH